jgi:hypothetical protein
VTSACCDRRSVESLSEARAGEPLAGKSVALGVGEVPERRRVTPEERKKDRKSSLPSARGGSSTRPPLSRSISDALGTEL